MMKQYVFAGFGGQGMLLIGKFLAMANMLDGKHVSWLPSYGPEMRGGTANCSVCVSDEEIGSPLVDNCDVLIAMNLPSLDKFENDIVPGGMVFYDSSLIERGVTRTDIRAFPIPATKMANDAGFATLANMIVMGKMLKETNMFPAETIDKTLAKVVSARKQNLLELNKTAIRLGYEL